MTGDSFAALLGVLAGSDLHDWSLPAVASALRRPVERTPTGRYVTAPGPEGVRLEVVGDPDVDDPRAAGAVYGLGLTVPAGFTAALAQAREVFGPVPTVGGPGPFARWPGGRVRWTLARSPHGGSVRAFAEPAQRAAEDERRDFDLGGVRSVPYLWRSDDPARLPADAWRPAPPVAAGVAAVLAQLPPVCAGLADAVSRLPDDVPGGGFELTGRRGRHGRCWFDATGATVEVDGTAARHPAGEVGARAVADALAAAVASWDVTRPARHLTHRPVPGPGRLLVLPGLGVPHARR